MKIDNYTNYTKNFMNVYRVAEDAIKNYDNNDVKFWARLEWQRIAKAIHQNISANVLIQVFPRNPDAIMDDTWLTTPTNDSGDDIVAKNYLKAFKSVAALMVLNDRIYNRGYQVIVRKNTNFLNSLKRLFKRILSPEQEIG